MRAARARARMQVWARRRPRRRAYARAAYPRHTNEAAADGAMPQGGSGGKGNGGAGVTTNGGSKQKLRASKAGRGSGSFKVAAQVRAAPAHPI